ncbi:MAG: PCRF domain-containing protein, partial [Propionibacteriaceae bacterium]
MAEGTDALVAEHAQIERRLADPATHADAALARRLGRRYAELSPIVAALAEHSRLVDDLETAKELAAEDRFFEGEVATLTTQLSASTEKLTRLLAPRDPHDSADAIIEIKSGEGGEESALFAADLVKMYSRYA